MTRYRLDLAYDGSEFHGYARQPNVRTVQGVLDGALEQIIGPVSTETAGRTDAGVHARHQVASFEGEADIDCRKLVRSLSKLLGPEVVVYRCQPVGDEFSARFSAAYRVYRYRILNRPFPDPLRRGFAWHVKDPLDVDAMHEAVQTFIGEWDFASFCRKAEGRTTVRTVLDASWCARPNDILRFSVILPDAEAETLDQVRGFYQEIEDGIEALPDVESVGVVWGPPLGRGRATGTVRVSRPVSSSANRNSFHVRIRPNTAVAAMPPFTCGRQILKKTRHSELPSMRAASSTSRGSSSKKLFIIHIVKGRLNAP